jgi:hypothetical protein
MGRMLLAGILPFLSAAAHERAWLTLLHYKNGQSQADGRGFFLSDKGKSDPEAEMKADLEAPDLQCRFPARWHWLKERFKLDVPDQPCPKYEQWRAAIDASRVTLVYADAFLNNPASMYGHTFLRLGDRGLLDYTISFAGNPDTENALFYALKGLTGAFPGTYSTQPYYMKVQEYNNIESRDLWEYDLKLSDQAKEQLIRHAWEMGSTHFDYYFFSENCSYQLLTLLDGADPELHLSDRFGFGAIPTDTVRAAIDRGVAKLGRYRPSHVREMLARRSLLSPSEIVLAETAPAGRAVVYDAAYDYRRYKHGFSDEVADRELLLARGKLGEPPTPAPVPPRAPLERGHDTALWSLGAGASLRGGFEELSYRPGLHDLAADPSGYAETSQLEMGELRLRFDNRERRPYVERATLVDIVSLTPWDRWVRKPSWRVSAGVEQAKELGKAPDDSMVFDVSPGIGLSAQWGPALLFGFGDVDVSAGPALPEGWRMGIGPTAGALWRMGFWRVLASGTYREFGQRSPHQERLKITSSWTLSRDWELRLNLDRRTPDAEAGLSLIRYF